MNFGITGTDTEVGKTVVSCALIAALRARGKSVAAMKPAETGIDNAGQSSSDTFRLNLATGNPQSIELVRPYAFSEPIAPLVAAERSGQTIDTARLDKAFNQLKLLADCVVVEGAGGILTPLTTSENYATLFSKWDLSVLIVTANRLGTINHTLLTVESAKRHGLDVSAVILNETGPPDHSVASATNKTTLENLLGDLTVISFPMIPETDQLHHLTQMGTIILKHVL